MRTSPSFSAARRSAAGMNGGRCCATSPGQDSAISGFTGAAPCASAVSGTKDKKRDQREAHRPLHVSPAPHA